ncbi:hypothetical protein G7092_19770 [Mucilaginibacter sp. HC2]|uniref:DUF5684 domain-containing protein n=1 Tax=Mucilaginibacter inviolabilis TaxID=2714892 RepID=UPI00140B9FD7|nr:DUF5684 domain-containing protein [Mucilaginibacter inviolabilis]NHA06059.1 hypothetical protein [Mucilaginibacter inviolabilis]
MQDYDPSSAASAGIFMACIIPILIISIISIISMWKIFEKAGKPGWASIIPIYSVIVLLEIIGKPIWWIFLLLIPCTGIVFIPWTINLLSKSFGQGVGFTIGIFFLSFIFLPILAFGNYQYLGPAGAGFVGGGNPFDPSRGYKDPFSNTPPPPQV